MASVLFLSSGIKFVWALKRVTNCNRPNVLFVSCSGCYLQKSSPARTASWKRFDDCCLGFFLDLPIEGEEGDVGRLEWKLVFHAL